MHFHHSLAPRSRWRRSSMLAFALLLALASLYFHNARAGRETAQPSAARDSVAGAHARYRYVAATGHNIGPRVAALYDQGGGLSIFGLPLTEEIDEDGMRVQYFERARFELRPGGEIGLTPLGALLTRDRAEAAFSRLDLLGGKADAFQSAGDRALAGVAWRSEAPVAAAPDFDPVSGHALSSAFGAFWRANRGPELLGRPISEVFSEYNPYDGRHYQVQYFERARLELHPEFAGTASEVLLGLLGREYADARALDPGLRAPAAPIVALGTATLPFSPAAGRARNIALAADRLDGRVVASGQELSFLESMGEITRAAGFALDEAIVGGELTREIGGGICYASTALYRAAFRAGLEIVERHPHSLPLDRRGDQLGFDASVYSPGLDLRWRNDTPAQIEVAASVDAAAGSITITLWGAGDGRAVTVRGPAIKNRRAPAPDIWRYDGALPAGASRKIADGVQGMDLVFSRVVRAADGHVLRQDGFRTHYAPRGASYRFGKGVAPPEGAVVE